MPGRGHVRKRGKSSWEITYEVAPRSADGKRHQKTKTVRGTKRDAHRTLREILQTLDVGTYVEPSRRKVGDYLDQWLQDHAEPKLEGRTVQRYREIIELHLKPALGHFELCQLRPTHIQQYYTDAHKQGHKRTGKGLSATTVLQHHRVLRKALQDGLRLQLIARNPADAVQPPKAQRKELCVLTEAEARSLQDACEGSRLAVPVMIALATGCSVTVHPIVKTTSRLPHSFS